MEMIYTESVNNKIELKARGIWEEKTRIRILVDEFHPFYMDEPEVTGGTNSAPNPMQYILSALCGCTAIITANIAGESHITCQAIEVEAAGEIDPRGIEEAPGILPYYETINETIIIKSDEDLEKLKKLSIDVERRCPALNMIRDSKTNLNVYWQKI